MRDCRKGKGEKLISVVIMVFLKLNLDPNTYEEILRMFVDYGCWKDLLKIIEIETRFKRQTSKFWTTDQNCVEIKLFAEQLTKDNNLLLNCTSDKKPAISLCAKWAPSEKNTLCASSDVRRYMHI